MQVGDHDDGVMVASFINELKACRFFFQLAKENPKSLRKCLEKAHQYPRGKEANMLKQETEQAYRHIDDKPELSI